VRKELGGALLRGHLKGASRTNQIRMSRPRIWPFLRAISTLQVRRGTQFADRRRYVVHSGGLKRGILIRKSVINIFRTPSITSRDINGLQANQRASPSAVRILCRFVLPLHRLASSIDAHYPRRKEWQVPLDKFSAHHDDLPHQRPLAHILIPCVNR